MFRVLPPSSESLWRTQAILCVTHMSRYPGHVMEHALVRAFISKSCCESLAVWRGAWIFPGPFPACPGPAVSLPALYICTLLVHSSAHLQTRMHLMLTKNAAHKPRKKNEAFLNFNMKLLKIYTSQFPSRGSYLTVVKQQYHLKLRLRVVSTSKTDDLHFLEKLKRAMIHINQLNVSCTLDLETRLERGHSEIGCKTFCCHFIYSTQLRNKTCGEFKWFDHYDQITSWNHKWFETWMLVRAKKFPLTSLTCFLSRWKTCPELVEAISSYTL